MLWLSVCIISPSFQQYLHHLSNIRASKKQNTSLSAKGGPASVLLLLKGGSVHDSVPDSIIARIVNSDRLAAYKIYSWQETKC